MSPVPAPPRLVLASTSPFRREILQKLAIPFDAAAPDTDETMMDKESPEALVSRLAESKARAVAHDWPNALIIGSDQVACVDGEILGKPGNRQNAMQQLTQAAGKAVTFYTGLCLLNSGSQQAQISCELFKVYFRQLNEAQIARYLDHEQPFNCAGSFKSEGMGITLFSKLEGDDPNTLIGLPLIRLVEMLGNEGIELP
jgi:septum formation protein